ncbi:MAG: hypothetical protein IJV87_03735 [Clostridia bacterium]|nr:hypothetical protein [Clostridia bacterium]
MRIYLKHIWRTIKAHPLQPILILLTVMLAVGVAVTAFRFQFAFEDYARNLEDERRALGDITVSLSYDSEERLLFADDAKEIVGDYGEVLGQYVLTGFMSDGSKRTGVTVCALDLLAADRYFQFKYLEYGKFTSSNIDSSVIISESFAEKNKLSVGDEIELSMLGEQVKYSVQGIARDMGCLVSGDVMISHASAVRLLAQRSPEIAALGDSFEPANKIMIKIYDKSDVERVFLMLKSSEEFCDDYVEDTALDSSVDMGLVAKRMGVALPAVLLTLLSAVLLITALAALDSRRAHEYALFRTAGADVVRLSALRLTESSIYALIGGALGVLLAKPMLVGVSSLFEWQKTAVEVEWSGALFGFLMAYLLMVGCTLTNILKQKGAELYTETSHGEYYGLRSGSAGAFILFSCAFAVSTAVTLALPAGKRMIPSAVAVCCLTVVAYTGTPYAVKWFSRLIQKLINRRRPMPQLLLAQKNIENNFSIKHVSRQLTVLLSLLAVIFTCCNAIAIQQRQFEDAFKGELLAYNMPESVADELKETQQAQGTVQFAIHPDATVNEKYSIILFSAQGDVDKCMNNEVLSKKLPEEGEIVVSKGIAVLLGASVGDSVNVSVQGNLHTFIVSDVIKESANIGYVSSDVVGEGEKLWCIRASSPDEAACERIIDSLNSRGVLAVYSKEYEIRGFDTVVGFTELVFWTAVVAILISLAGCLNMIFEAYRVRKHERHILNLSGMERKKIRAMGLYEGLTVIFASLILSLFFGGLLCILVNMCVQSFGFVLL